LSRFESKTFSSSSRRRDDSHILFEITENDEQVPCAISRAALEDIAGTRCHRTEDLLRCFAKARGRIEKVALEKLRARPSGVSGRLNVWSDDVGRHRTADADVMGSP